MQEPSSAPLILTEGEARDGVAARGGAGGELGLRVVPWRDAALSPHLNTGVGLLLFPNRPFLPGGDVYEGLITFGLGADLRLNPAWRLGARAFSVHLSNGQGLGAHNPAYDGFGAGLSLVHGSSSSAEAPAARRTPHAQVVASGDAALEGGRVGDAAFFGARVRAPIALDRRLSLLLDVEGGTLAEHAVVEPGLALVARASVFTAGAHLGYRRFAGLDVGVAALQVDTALTSEVTLVVMGHHERPEVFPNVWRAGVGLRARPGDDLTLDLGIGFDRLGDETVFGDDHSDPYMGVAWRLPWVLGDQRLVIFLERQISTVDVVGLRVERGPAPWSRLR